MDTTGINTNYYYWYQYKLKHWLSGNSGLPTGIKLTVAESYN